jgi:multiple sugar transport system permease protein
MWWRARRRGLTRTLSWKAGLAGTLFASPWIIGFVVFTAWPVLTSFVLSFTQYDVLHPPRWLGLDNYRQLLGGDPLFWKSLGNTFFMLLRIPLVMAAGLGLALLVRDERPGIKTYRTLFYMPAIVPAVASSVLWVWLLSPDAGLVDRLLGPLLKTLGTTPPRWLGDPAWAKPSLILMSLWAAGSGMIIWLAGLQGLPAHLYEAASLDGATRWHQFRHVTLPLMTPYILFNAIIATISTLQVFTEAYGMTNGGPADATLFYVYYLFNNAFASFKMGYASAMAWLLFALVLVLTLLQMRLSKKWVHYEQT